MQITRNFTLEEMTASSTAARLGIDNTPSADIKENIVRLVRDILQPIRDNYRKPIVVGSGYRCPRLNKAVGGVTNSQHQKGEAADIKSLSDTKEDNKVLFDLILGMVNDGRIKVGQLIDEYNYDWIHISSPRGRNDNQVLHLK